MSQFPDGFEKCISIHYINIYFFLSKKILKATFFYSNNEQIYIEIEFFQAFLKN